MSEPKPPIVLPKEVVFSAILSAAREKEKELVEELLTVGTVLSKNARGVILGKIMKSVVEQTVIQLGQQGSGKFDFTDFINSTEADLMKWVQDTQSGYLVPMATGRN